MDRRLKERLVGATLLVVLIVLIVPELLSGPKRAGNTAPAAANGSAESLRNVTVDLATSKATPAEDAAAASASPLPAQSESAPADEMSGASAPPTPRDAEQHAAASPSVTTLKAQQPVPSALENEPAAPKSPRADVRSAAGRDAGSGDAARRGWAVQIGSFASRGNADKALKQLKANESSAFLSVSGSGSSSRYRVRVGPFADRGSAEKALARLTKEGRPGSLIPP